MCRCVYYRYHTVLFIVSFPKPFVPENAELDTYGLTHLKGLNSDLFPYLISILILYIISDVISDLDKH